LRAYYPEGESGPEIGKRVAKADAGTETDADGDEHYGRDQDGDDGKSAPQTESTGSLIYARNHLGSVTDTLTPDGRAVTHTEYGPYGELVKSQGRAEYRSDFGYAGMQYHAASGMYLTLFRAYDPGTGRWVSRDPIGEDGGENLYAYANGNPENYVDPNGMLAIWPTNSGVILGKKYRCKYGKDAWSNARSDRNKMRGLNTGLRNAEHYLYAYDSVSSGEYNAGTMTALSIGYSIIKEVRNRIGGQNSPCRGSPPSVDEVEAGIQGAVDGALDDGGGVDAIKIKRFHFGASALILVVELFKFGHECVVDYSAIDIGGWLELVVVIALFVIARSWLLRISGWVSILLAVLLPLDIFPPFGDEVAVPSFMETILERVVVLFVAETAILSVAWVLLNLDRFHRKAVENSPTVSKNP
ncbi:RHS repeat-associated core domain-containing protein, partial [Ralstonia solanacearum]|uniref:RHS repeat-associated core domain-containing protein n=1 Tax=Ralstonia solanacearum TaxID=305 RepID=UPI001E4F516D